MSWEFAGRKARRQYEKQRKKNTHRVTTTRQDSGFPWRANKDICTRQYSSSAKTCNSPTVFLLPMQFWTVLYICRCRDKVSLLALRNPVTRLLWTFSNFHSLALIDRLMRSNFRIKIPLRSGHFPPTRNMDILSCPACYFHLSFSCKWRTPKRQKLGPKLKIQFSMNQSASRLFCFVLL